MPALTIAVHYFSISSIFPPELTASIAYYTIAGVFLFYWFMNQFITSSRIKFLERIFRYTTLMKVHGISTFGIIILITVHRLTHGLSLITAYIGFSAALIFAFLLIVSVCFWLDAPFARLLIIRNVNKLLRIDYAIYRLLHNLNAIAALLVVVHISRTNCLPTVSSLHQF